MIDNSTPDIQIANLKAKGMKNKDIAPIVYPDLPVESAVVKVSRHLKGQAGAYLEQSKLIALKKAGIDWEWIIEGIKEAGEATKQNNFTGEVTPDHSIRLSARKQARDLMEDKRVTPDNPAPPMNIPADADAIEILRAWKSPPPNS